jgi:uncharacterized protein (TIGR02996 family)
MRDESSIVRRVWEAPDDDDVRRVVADALLDQGDPWGELIALQLRRRDSVAIKTLLAAHADRIAGPIAVTARKDVWRFAKGFLVDVALVRQGGTRRSWEEAARAPHWATVERVVFEQTIPRWFLAIWARNPAVARGRLRAIVLANPLTLRLARRTRDEAWRVTYDRRTSINFKLLRGLAEGGMIIEGAREQ